MSRARINILGIDVDCIDQAALIDALLERARLGIPGYVITINLHDFIELRRTDGAFRSTFPGAAFVVPDGRPLLWMARLRGAVLHLVTGSDLVIPLCQAAARQKRSVFFFGTTFDALSACARKLHASIDGLDIRGVYAPPFDFEQNGNECLIAENVIRAAAPDIVFVALGKPKQEIWARENSEKLGVQAICVGASLDFIAGRKRRAPLAIRRMGLEWFWRALTEPRRLGMRYAMILCRFPILVIEDLLSGRRRAR